MIFGGSSSVGQYSLFTSQPFLLYQSLIIKILAAIQLAKLSGFSPIITTASLRSEDLVKSLGATHLVDRKSDVVAEVKKITSSPVEVIYDSIAEKDTQEQAWEILTPGGTLLVTGSPQIDQANHGDKYIENIFGNFFDPEKRAFGASFYSKLTQLFAEGTLKVRL